MAKRPFSILWKETRQKTWRLEKIKLLLLLLLRSEQSREEEPEGNTGSKDEEDDDDGGDGDDESKVEMRQNKLEVKVAENDMILLEHEDSDRRWNKQKNGTTVERISPFKTKLKLVGK